MEDSREAYEQAYKISEDNMKPTDPIHLGLALNFSVFYYEILNEHAKACDLAQKVRSCYWTSFILVDEKTA